MKPRRWCLRLLLLPGLLGGCDVLRAAPHIAGAGAAIISGAGTANPGVGVAIGLGVTAVTDYALKYYGRSRQDATQDAIASAASPLPPGGHAPWRIDHRIPIGNERGEVHVVRSIDNPLAPCREIMFSVEDGEGEAATRDWFAAQICRQGERWRWASAEPAVERWGALQ
jgi:hypothetical protein